jgi:hypothetical protein
MRWKKLGLVYRPSGENDMLITHASNPVAELLNRNSYRVYFSPRDSKNRSSIFSVNIIISTDGAEVISNSLDKVLDIGKRARFDDSGVSVAAIISEGEKRLLYYVGWNLAVTIPFRNAIGVAISESKGECFVRVSEAPIADRNHIDPISLSYPYLLWDNDRYKIWYGSCVEWLGNDVSDYQFSLKYAESFDGLVWERLGESVIECDFPKENAIARPSVIKEDDMYKMWYSKKEEDSYRIGYAESSDGVHWKRMDDKAGITVSRTGWDSEMIEYPYVFDHKGSRYMLYNGNGYGKTGFGLAVLDRNGG